MANNHVNTTGNGLIGDGGGSSDYQTNPLTRQSSLTSVYSLRYDDLDTDQLDDLLGEPGDDFQRSLGEPTPVMTMEQQMNNLWSPPTENMQAVSAMAPSGSGEPKPVVGLTSMEQRTNNLWSPPTENTQAAYAMAPSGSGDQPQLFHAQAGAANAMYNRALGKCMIPSMNIYRGYTERAIAIAQTSLAQIGMPSGGTMAPGLALNCLAQSLASNGVINGHPNGLSSSPVGNHGLDNHGLDGSMPGLNMGRNRPVEDFTERKQKRMIKNRESAAKSRTRKLDYTSKLEAEVTQMKEQIKTFERDKAKLQAEATQLKEQIKTLERDKAKLQAEATQLKEQIKTLERDKL